MLQSTLNYVWHLWYIQIMVYAKRISFLVYLIFILLWIIYFILLYSLFEKILPSCMNFLQFVMSIWKFSLAFQVPLWYHLWLTLITMNFLQFCETLIRLGPFYVKASGFLLSYAISYLHFCIFSFSYILTLLERVFAFAVYQDMWIIWDCIHTIMYT